LIPNRFALTVFHCGPSAATPPAQSGRTVSKGNLWGKRTISPSPPVHRPE
jgi:hypothetical protein